MASRKNLKKPHPSEEIWKILREVSEGQKDTDQKMRETALQMKETDRKMQETERQIKETERQVKETSAIAAANSQEILRTRGLFTNQWGRLIESLVEGNLLNQLLERGIEIDMVYPNAKIVERRTDSQGKLVREVVCEIDLLARNGTEKAAVEVKTYLSSKDVEDYIGVLSRHSAAIAGPARSKILGGIAFLRLQKGADVYAQRAGLFTIKVSGENAKITNRKAFKPKIFNLAAGLRA